MNFLLDTVLSGSYRVTTVTDVYEGMVELKRSPIELIVIDIDYNTQENLDFIHHIQTSGLYQDLPVFVLSSKEEGSLEDSYIAAGLTWIHKPFSPLDIVRNVDELFAKTLI